MMHDRSQLSGLQGGILKGYRLISIMYDETLRDAMDKIALMKSRTIVLRPDAPWYNEDITKQKRIRRRLERKWRSSKL